MEEFSLSPSLCAATDFVVFVFPVLESRLLCHVICHLTLVSGSWNKHRYRNVTVFELPADDGRRECSLWRLSEGCVFWCAGVRGLRVLMWTGHVTWRLVSRHRGVSLYLPGNGKLLGYSFVVSSTARNVWSVRYSKRKGRLLSAIRFNGEKYIFKFPELLWNPKAYLPVYKILPLALVLSRRPDDVDIVPRNRLDGPGTKSRWSGRFCLSVFYRSWSPPSLLYNRYRLLRG